MRFPVFLTLCLAFVSAVSAAEVRGRVLLEDGARAKAGGTIGVALLRRPDTDRPKATLHEIRLHGGRLQPAYLMVRTGDRVRLVNADPVHHEIFSVGERPVGLHLNPAGTGEGSQGELTLARPGLLHLFCRIHSRAYARIEVLDALAIRHVRPGETFEFVNLAPGSWKLYISGPGLETRLWEVDAITSPPPATFTLQALSPPLRGDGKGIESAIPPERLYPDIPLDRK